MNLKERVKLLEEMLEKVLEEVPDYGEEFGYCNFGCPGDWYKKPHSKDCLLVRIENYFKEN